MNDDQQIDLADAVTLLGYVAGSGVKPPCFIAADANGSGTVDLADGVYEISYVTNQGPPPPAPFPDCDVEPAPPSGLSCDNRPSCP